MYRTSEARRGFITGGDPWLSRDKIARKFYDLLVLFLHRSYLWETFVGKRNPRQFVFSGLDQGHESEVTCRFALAWIAMAVTFAASSTYAVAQSTTAMPTPTRARMPWSISTGLTPNARGQLYSPFRTSSSHIVKLGGPVVPGIPANSIPTPVAVLSCDAAYEGKTEATYFQTIRVTVMNETPYYLRYTRIAFKIDRNGSYEDAILFDLKPYEMRSFIGSEGGYAAGGRPQDHPHWMLCGAGPAVLANGKVLQFEPSFLSANSP